MRTETFASFVPFFAVSAREMYFDGRRWVISEDAELPWRFARFAI
jgi:hypothetical protein